MFNNEGFFALAPEKMFCEKAQASMEKTVRPISLNPTKIEERAPSLLRGYNLGQLASAVRLPNLIWIFSSQKGQTRIVFR